MKLFFFDLETSGLSPAKNGIHQIGFEIVIDNCRYPTPTVADFISFDRTVKFKTEAREKNPPGGAATRHSHNDNHTKPDSMTGGMVKRILRLVEIAMRTLAIITAYEIGKWIASIL